MNGNDNPNGLLLLVILYNVADGWVATVALWVAGFELVLMVYEFFLEMSMRRMKARR